MERGLVVLEPRPLKVKLRALNMMPSRVTWNFSTSILINILETMIMADLAFWYKLMFATVCEVKLSPKSWTESRTDSEQLR